MDGRAQTGQRLQQEIASSGQTGLAMPTEQERLAMFKMYVSRLFSQSTPVEETLQEYAEALVQYFSVALVRIWLFDRAGKVLELYSSAGRYTYHDGLHTRISIGQGKIGQIARDGQPYFSNAAESKAIIPPQEWARHLFYGCPPPSPQQYKEIWMKQQILFVDARNLVLRLRRIDHSLTWERRSIHIRPGRHTQ